MKVDLSELRALEQAATPGPWLTENEPHETCIWTRQPHTGHLASTWDEDMNGVFPMKENAALIVALRNAAPALLDAYAERDRLREQVDTLTSALAEAVVIIARYSPEGVDGLRALLTDHSEEGR